MARELNDPKTLQSSVLDQTSGEKTLQLVCRLVPVVITVVTVVAFLPALQNGFVDWDDRKTLLENPHYRGLGWEHLVWAFTTFYKGHYQPLSWVTFGLDYIFWGMDPFGYHLTNILLHAANAALFYFLVIRLLVSSMPGGWSAQALLRIAAGFAALLFAVHPLRVESVAWATERRDLLAGFFFLTSLLCYLKANAAPRDSGFRLWWMTAAVITHGFSLLSKVIGITLPIILLILDVYPLRRIGEKGQWFGGRAAVWREKIPFLIFAFVAGVVGIMAQSEAGAMYSLQGHGLLARLAQAFYGVVFYLQKTLLPFDLIPIYEIPRNFDPWDGSFLLSGVFVVGVSAVLVLLRHAWKAGLASWAAYIVLLFPVLGFTQSGPQLVADRYSYFSCLVWALLAGAGLFYGWQACLRSHLGRWAFVAVFVVATSIISGLGVLTWKQVMVWRDTESLWRHTVSLAPLSRIAHNNLGQFLANKAKVDEAIRHYHEALRIDPLYALAHYNLGVALYGQNKLDEAILQFSRAIRIKPDYQEAHYDLGNSLASKGDLGGAIKHYREALRIKPNDAAAHNNLGLLLAREGRTKEAIGHFREALDVDPNSAKTHANLAIGLVKLDQLEGAIEHFQLALKMQPNFAEGHNNLGRVIAAKGDLDKAIEHFRQALRIEPNYAEAHQSLGQALAQQGKKKEAIQHYEEALRLMKARIASPVSR